MFITAYSSDSGEGWSERDGDSGNDSEDEVNMVEDDDYENYDDEDEQDDDYDGGMSYTRCSTVTLQHACSCP